VANGKPVLRPYQNDLVADVKDALRSTRRVLLQSPTGSGKTVLTAHMIGTAADRGLRSWFLVHRRELLEQTADALWANGVSHGVIAAGRSQTDDLVQVATIQSLVRRLERLPRPNFVIVDEAQHTPANSYRKVLEHCSDSWVVGLTATPCRSDGRGLDDIFDALVLGPTVEELTSEGYLAPYRAYGPSPALDLSGVHSRGGDWVRSELEELIDQSAIVGDAVSHYLRLVHPRTCLVYCVSRKHARHVEAAYRSAGIDARYCAGDTPKAERRAIVAGLKIGNPPVVVSVDLFGEGLDAPGLAAVQLLRPTQSLGLHLQQCGRVMRPEEGKDHAIILDHVRNCLRHGLPDDERVWTLKGERRKRNGGEAAVGLRSCDQCFAIYPAVLSACPRCGFMPAPGSAQRLPDEVDGELVEIEKARVQKARRREEGMTKGLEALVELGIERGYKPGWAGTRHAVRQGFMRNTPEFYKVLNEARKLAKEMG
jgi:superfamily II DNA or RNA helicase